MSQYWSKFSFEQLCKSFFEEVPGSFVGCSLEAFWGNQPVTTTVTILEAKWQRPINDANFWICWRCLVVGCQSFYNKFSDEEFFCFAFSFIHNSFSSGRANLSLRERQFAPLRTIINFLAGIKSGVCEKCTEKCNEKCLLFKEGREFGLWKSGWWLFLIMGGLIMTSCWYRTSINLYTNISSKIMEEESKKHAKIKDGNEKFVCGELRAEFLNNILNHSWLARVSTQFWLDQWGLTELEDRPYFWSLLPSSWRLARH